MKDKQIYTEFYQMINQKKKLVLILECKRRERNKAKYKEQKRGLNKLNYNGNKSDLNCKVKKMKTEIKKLSYDIKKYKMEHKIPDREQVSVVAVKI